MKVRADELLVQRKLVRSRSQAADLIRRGKVTIGGMIITKPGKMVDAEVRAKVHQTENYVSRAGEKLASIAEDFSLQFYNKTVLDVGSSTGGFTDYALQHGATKVIAVDVGTKQLHPSLHGHPLIELHEQTDIRGINILSSDPDVVVLDVSFISLRQILPHVLGLISKTTQVVAMVKPQFEIAPESKHKGVIKNDRLRRDVLKEFEQWVRDYFVIMKKADSKLPGAKGNIERFYMLKKL